LLTTDGLVECPNPDFSDPLEVARRFDAVSNADGLTTLLEEIKEKNVRIRHRMTVKTILTCFMALII
jgi:hypothetical protein